MVNLDTNFLIDALLPGSLQEAQLVAWLAAGEPLGISSLAWGEFLCGPLSPAAEVLARRLLPHVETLEATDAERAAALFNLAGRRSKSFPIAVSRRWRCAIRQSWRRAIEAIFSRWRLMAWCSRDDWTQHGEMGRGRGEF